MKATVIGLEIKIGEHVYKLDDLYDDDFYVYTNSLADKFYNETYGVNDIFNNIVQRYYIAEQWVKRYKITEVDVKRADEPFKLLFTAVSSNENVQVTGLKPYEHFKVVFFYLCNIFGEAIFFTYLLSKIPYKP